MGCATYYQNERTEIARLLPPEYKRVLEVGCGEGNFSKNFKQRCEVWGCEPNEQAAAVASTKLSKVLVGKYESIVDDLPDQYFDLVVCNDVIEHMEDHDWFFDSIAQKMKPDGFLVGSVPNVRHIRNLYQLIFKKDWQYQDTSTLDRTHLRFFSQKSLLRTLKEHGFTVDLFQGINGTENLFNHIVLFSINLVTFWQHRDIEHLQFAFRIRQGNPSNRSLKPTE